VTGVNKEGLMSPSKSYDAVIEGWVPEGESMVHMKRGVIGYIKECLMKKTECEELCESVTRASAKKVPVKRRIEVNLTVTDDAE